MSKTIPTDKNQSQVSLEEQASKDNIFFSESLNEVIGDSLANSLVDSESEKPTEDILTVGFNKFSVFPLKIERIEEDIFIDFKIHNFNILDFIDFNIATIDMSQKSIECKLISYSCPSEKTENGLIRILLSGGT